MTRLHLDFETYSEVKLLTVGTSRYARDPSTEVLMLGFAFDEAPVRQWIPVEGQLMPPELREALEDPAVQLFAWNKPFEWSILAYVLNIPTAHERWRDPMVLAYSLALPGSLEKAGEVVDLGADAKKLSYGKVLIRQFCQPRVPTKKKPWTRTEPHHASVRWEQFLAYNRRDVEAERAFWKRVKRWDMPLEEWELWCLDQRINERGIPINMRVVRNAIRVSRAVVDKRLAEMRKITELGNPNSVAQLLPWLQGEGYPFDDLKKGHVKRARDEAPPGDYRQVLALRSEVSRASVKKFTALQNATDDDGRLRHTLQFAGAGRTWRWAGRKFQAQNLARPAPWLERTQEEAVRDLEWLDPEEIEWLYPAPMDLLSTCVRPVVQAPPGYMLVDADLNAIENRALGWVSDDRKIMRVFEENRDPYIDFATYMYRMPYDDLYAEYKTGIKGKRTIAKPAVLGCFGADTLVLTDRGWRRIVDVTAQDRVHDGVEFVEHEGVIDRGRRATIELAGVAVTPDHEILVSDQWVWACQLAEKPQILRRASSTARGLLSNWLKRTGQGDLSTGADALAERLGISRETIWCGDAARAVPGVRCALAGHWLVGKLARRYTIFSQTVFTLCGAAVTILRPSLTPITAGAGLSVGSLTRTNLFCSRFRSWARTVRLRLTGSITTAITSPAIFGSRIEVSKTVIGETATGSSIRAKSTVPESSATVSPRLIGMLQRWVASIARGCLPSKSLLTKPGVAARTVYDIANAGTRYRFVIWTDAGPLIVHNCGYMLGPGAEKENVKTGEIEATGLLGYAWNMGVRLTLEQSEASVKIWRETFTGVVDFWRRIDKAARRCIRTGQPQECGRLRFDRSGPFMRMILPSGRALHYCRPRIENRKTPWGETRATITYEGLSDTNQWVRIATHPGKLTENAVQAIARDLLAHGMRLADVAGIDIRLHVHDEILALALEDRAADTLRVLQDCMTTRPAWALDLPLGSAGTISRVFMKD
jgi:hypothetical protein